MKRSHWYSKHAKSQCKPSSLDINSLEKVSPGMMPRFLSQKMEQKLHNTQFSVNWRAWNHPLQDLFAQIFPPSTLTRNDQSFFWLAQGIGELEQTCIYWEVKSCSSWGNFWADRRAVDDKILTIQPLCKSSLNLRFTCQRRRCLLPQQMLPVAQQRMHHCREITLMLYWSCFIANGIQ